jgi:hypothetical protein
MKSSWALVVALLTLSLNKAHPISNLSRTSTMLKVGQAGLCLLPTFFSEATMFSEINFLVSELQLDRKLDRARAADLVERVETAVCAAGTQTVG